MANVLIEKVGAVGGLEVEIWTEDFQHAVEGHPEVRLDKVRGALKYPSKVIQSKSSSNTCLFYSIEIKIHKTESLYFCVVVAVTSSGKGKMVTAYDADFIKTGIELYSKNKR